jgi:hypothetical protein
MGPLLAIGAARNTFPSKWVVHAVDFTRPPGIFLRRMTHSCAFGENVGVGLWAYFKSRIRTDVHHHKTHFPGHGGCYWRNGGLE